MSRDKCKHDTRYLYSETISQRDISGVTHTKRQKNGMLNVSGRPEILIDFCFTCQKWVYDGRGWDSDKDIADYYDTGFVLKDWRWNVEIIFCRTDGTWNIDRRYIPFDPGNDGIEPTQADQDWVYENAKNAALREFDSSGIPATVSLAYRGIYSINLEEKL